MAPEFDHKTGRIMVRRWATTDLEGRIAHHMRAWEHAKQAPESHPAGGLAFVTINRDFGCEALHVADVLTAVLNERAHPRVPWVAYDRQLLDRVASELHLRREVVESMDGLRRSEMTEFFDTLLNRKPSDALMVHKLAEVVRSLAIHGHTVIVGRGSHLITKDLKSGLHVRLTAPREWRVHRVAASRKVSESTAEQTVAEIERERAHFLQTFFIHDPEHPFVHDLTIDASQFAPVEIADIIGAAVQIRELPLADAA